MIKYLTFYKEIDKWYVSLNDWTGSKDDLEMVLGADTMLDILSQGKDSVEVCLSTNTFDNYKYILERTNNYDGGYWYDLKSEYINFPVWLCYVTEFVFEEFPNKIYLREM